MLAAQLPVSTELAKVSPGLEHLQDWVGNTQTLDDRVGSTPVASLSATLDRDATAAVSSDLPPLWHWLYFLPQSPASEIGKDGHPGLAVTEEQDIVYRPVARPDDVVAAPVRHDGEALWRRELTPDEVLLFRYVALTFNAHRIQGDTPVLRRAYFETPRPACTRRSEHSTLGARPGRTPCHESKL